MADPLMAAIQTVMSGLGSKIKGTKLEKEMAEAKKAAAAKDGKALIKKYDAVMAAAKSEKKNLKDKAAVKEIEKVEKAIKEDQKKRFDFTIKSK